MVELPEWSAFEANAAPVLPEHAERPGRLVAIVATRRVGENGWAMEAAVDMVRAWSESGRKVVLADTALADPTLHECLDVDNAEGVIDTVVFGSSVRQVTKRSEGDAFFVITAGTASADSGAVLASERWERLSRDFVEAGVTLVSYVGAESDGKAAVLGLATDVVVLAESTQDAVSALDGSAAPVRAVIGPPSPKPDALAPGDPPGGVLDPLAAVEVSAGDVDDSVEQGEALVHGTDAGLPEDVTLPEAKASIVEASKGGVAPVATGSRRLLLFAVSLVLLLIVAAVVLGWIDIPGISPIQNT